MFIKLKSNCFNLLVVMLGENVTCDITAIPSDSRPPKFEMPGINNFFLHLSAVANSIASQLKIRQI